MATTPKRGEVYLVSFDPTIGHEIKKARPAVIIQNNIGNQYSPTVIVAAIASGRKTVYPVQVLIRPPQAGLRKVSIINLAQIRTIDKRRLGRRLGQLKPKVMKEVDKALLISMALPPYSTFG